MTEQRHTSGTKKRRGKRDGMNGMHPFEKDGAKKKMKAAGIAIILAALAGSGIFSFFRLREDRDKEKINMFAEDAEEKSDYYQQDNEIVRSIISKAERLAAENDYEGAREKILAAQMIFPKSKILEEKSKEYMSVISAEMPDTVEAETEDEACPEAAEQ